MKSGCILTTQGAMKAQQRLSRWSSKASNDTKNVQALKSPLCIDEAIAEWLLRGLCTMHRPCITLHFGPLQSFLLWVGGSAVWGCPGPQNTSLPSWVLKQCEPGIDLIVSVVAHPQRADGPTTGPRSPGSWKTATAGPRSLRK